MDADRFTNVRDNPERQRYELETAAGLAVAEYRRDGDVVTIFHTEVPAALRGHGIGETLVRGALEDIRHRGFKVVPRCWFVRAFVEDNPWFGDLISRP